MNSSLIKKQSCFYEHLPTNFKLKRKQYDQESPDQKTDDVLIIFYGKYSFANFEQSTEKRKFNRKE